MAFTKLIIAGSTGNVADHAIRAILASTKPVFDVTILTRANSGKTLPVISGAKVVPIDYYNHQALVSVVSGADAILSFLAGAHSKFIDRLLLKAAQAAGVRRIFPSEYTLDILHPKAVTALTEGGHWPEDMSPVVTARKFLALAEEGGPTSFTTIVCSGFIDGWLEGKFGSMYPKAHRVTAMDSGDNYWTGCSLPFIAAVIVALLRMDEEKTKNKRIRIAEVRMTLNQIADTFEEVTGVKFDRDLDSSKQLLEDRNTKLKEGNPFGAMFDMIHMTAFNGCGAGDLEDGLTFDADGYLQYKRKTLKELVAETVQKIGPI